MKSVLILVLGLLLTLPAIADTPAPGTVKAKAYSGDGNTAITATGTSLNVNVTNSGGLSTVSQGDAGVESWLVSVTDSALPANACQETGGHLASIDSKLTSPIAVTGSFFPAVQPVALASPIPTGSNTIGAVNVNGTVPVSGTFWQATQPVSGTFWQATQPVSGTFWQATQPVSGTVTANAGTGTFTVDASGFTVPVSGTFWQATQPISAAALPLPSGAATALKQPAFGTAGAPSADVLTVQGATSMTALKVDASATTQPVVLASPLPTGANTIGAVNVNGTVPVSGTFWQATQPVSGTVTANIGTSGSLALDASVTGLQVSQSSTTSGQKGGLTLGAVTTAAPSYTTGNSNPFSLTTAGALRIDGSGSTQPVSGTFWQATQPVSLTTLPALTTGSAVIGKVSIDQTTPGTTNLVALAANQSVNTAQINGVTPLMGNGTTGTGSQRVTIASDNTAFSVNAIPKTAAAVTVKQAAITVGTSAVRLTNDGSAPPSTRVLLVAQLLSSSTANCYFGSSGVTTTSTTRGVQMFAGQTLSFNNDAGDYYAICDASSQTILVTEQE